MRFLAARIALAPTALIVAVVFVGAISWTIGLSFTPSRGVPEWTFVGLDQYHALFRSSRWIVSLKNMVIFGVGLVGGAMILGVLLAIFVDQNLRGEGLFRTIFLYPFALSYIVTGFAWQWFLNPKLGLQKFVQDLGWDTFSFKLLIDRDLAIYTIVAAAIWHSAGLVMAIMLAGLRGIDEEIWKATRVEGIPRWRTYASIVLPMSGPALVTSLLLLTFGVIRNYDLVVAMTNGGPGNATEVPAKFVMDYLFERQNAALASAGAVIMLITLFAAATPLWYLQRRNARRLTDLQKG
jgi:glucose/mannose transport system permease protein